MMNAETFSENVAGEMNGHIETLKNIYVSQLLREWCANNNYFPEAISMISAPKEEADKIIETISTQMTSTLRNGALILRTMQGIKQALSSDIKTVNGEGGGDANLSSSSSDTGSSDTGSGSGEDQGGNDDDNVSFDLKL